MTAGVINSGKKIESDLKDYINWFSQSADFSFSQYIFLKGNDILYFIYNYLFYHNVSASGEVYIFCTTVLAYLIIFFAGYRHFSTRSGVKTKLVLLCIFLPFPLIFINSAHFLRQFLAGAIVVFAIYGVNTNKARLFSLLLASLVHSSAFIFVIFMCIPIRKWKLKQLILMGISIPLILKALSLLNYHETGYPLIDVIYYRIVVQTGPTLVMSTFAVLLAALVLMLSILTTRFDSPEDKPKNVYMGLSAFMVLVFYTMPATVELSLRFAYYIWMLLPVFLATKINIKTQPTVTVILIAASYAASIVYVINNQWDFSCGVQRLFTFEIGFSSCVY